MQGSQTRTDELQSLMTNVLMAQDYQDLTGQVIRRVIELVREVEDSLINLLTVFGTTDEQPGKAKRSEAKAAPKDIEDVNVDDISGPEGPIIDADSRDDVVSGQDEVDDLLSSLGF
jgi:chemotaxis protein CheZ